MLFCVIGNNDGKAPPDVTDDSQALVYPSPQARPHYQRRQQNHHRNNNNINTYSNKRLSHGSLYDNNSSSQKDTSDVVHKRQSHGALYGCVPLLRGPDCLGAGGEEGCLLGPDSSSCLLRPPALERLGGRKARSRSTGDLLGPDHTDGGGGGGGKRGGHVQETLTLGDVLIPAHSDGGGTGQRGDVGGVMSEVRSDGVPDASLLLDDDDYDVVDDLVTQRRAQACQRLGGDNTDCDYDNLDAEPAPPSSQAGGGGGSWSNNNNNSADDEHRHTPTRHPGVGVRYDRGYRDWNLGGGDEQCTKFPVLPCDRPNSDSDVPKFPHLGFQEGCSHSAQDLGLHANGGSGSDIGLEQLPQIPRLRFDDCFHGDVNSAQDCGLQEQLTTCEEGSSESDNNTLEKIPKFPRLKLDDGCCDTDVYSTGDYAKDDDVFSEESDHAHAKLPKFPRVKFDDGCSTTDLKSPRRRDCAEGDVEGGCSSEGNSAVRCPVRVTVTSELCGDGEDGGQHELADRSQDSPSDSVLDCPHSPAASPGFGKRSQGCGRRTSECLTLEPSEMIAIDYPDVQALKGGHPHRTNINSANLDRFLAPDPEHDLRGGMRRMNSDGGIEQLPPDGGGGAAGVQLREPFVRSPQHLKRSSHASDTSSAYSGSDMMQSSLDDQDNPEAELSGLVESVVDSDDEEGYAESNESYPIRDAVRDCLEKDPSERTDDDIEILMDFMQHFRAFANMTQMTRRALCSVMVFAVVPHEGTVVMKDGEELDSWSVILNGEVEVTRPDTSRERLQMGDSFGITPTMQKLYHKGVMQTMTDDCQFVCIAQQDYYRILHQGEENTRRHEEKGQVVMVTEHRELDGGNRRGHIVIRGSSERLMQHLVEDHSTIDPTYVEDFLLTYRTFLPNALHLANKLLLWFENAVYRPKVTRVVLYWVNNHFNDFETDPALCEFLEHFECLLERERMMGQMSLLNMACAAKAKVRTVTLTRTTRDEILYFSILGGLERGHGIFITKVEAGSKAAEAGLKRGDQILEVNGKKFDQIYYNKALEILRGSTHLSISVKSNLQEKNTPRKVKREEHPLGHMAKQRLSVPDLDSALSYISTTTTTTAAVTTTTADKKPERKGLFNFGSKPRIKKALEKMNIIPKMNGNNINHSDESLYSKPSRKSSTSSSSSSTVGVSTHLSASNPDLSTLTLGVPGDDKSDFPEHVVKVYRADQSFKFLLIHKETTAKNVVMLALTEFGITEASGNFSLCEVTVESEMFIKRRRLADQLTNLPERLNLNGRRSVARVHRYYLKNNLSSDPLIPDDMIGELLKESHITLLQLNAPEVALQLTLEDFKVFREIEPTEYVDELFELDSKYGCPTICKFAELVNREMFWVVTEICSEHNVVKRMKLIKHFIKIAKCCKDSKNFNSMFAIMSGLRHGSVSRLRGTWEKLPNKYCKMFEDLETLMDPSRNMAKYRNLLNSKHIQPPVIPIFPVVKKDLTFIHLGNDSYIDALVNFEKLRMIAKEIRHTANMCSGRYDVSNMLLSTNNQFGSSLVSGMATLKRTKNRRGSTLPNPKKMYEEAQMVRKVRSYLSTMPANCNEEALAEMSNQCEAPARKRDASPSVQNSPNLEDKRSVPVGPKFGTESPGAVRKIMALTDKVRPHNPKVPVPPVTSPGAGRRGPSSPRHLQGGGHPLGPNRLLPVRLTHESSSVVSLGNMPLRKTPLRTGSLGSMELCTDSDSGHGSSTSTFEPHHPHHPARSLAPSRLSQPSLQHPHLSYTQPGLPVPQTRPPLPSYSVVMHNANMNNAPVSSHSSFPGYPHVRRPPLPDYQLAASMAQRYKSLAVGDRTQSLDGVYDRQASEDAEEEQVSAV